MKLTRIALSLGLAVASGAYAQTVKIGVINSMSGAEAPIGENLTNGIKMAEEDLKKKGIQVQLSWEDDTGKPQIAMSAMEKLATRDNVVGVVGPYTSACANAVSCIANSKSVTVNTTTDALVYGWGYYSIVFVSTCTYEIVLEGYTAEGGWNAVSAPVTFTIGSTHIRYDQPIIHGVINSTLTVSSIYNILTCRLRCRAYLHNHNDGADYWSTHVSISSHITGGSVIQQGATVAALGTANYMAIG